MPLRQHIDEYETDSMAQGSKPKHGHQTADRLRLLAQTAGFAYWSDITPSKVQKAIDRIRHADQPLKTATRNHYVAVMKSFCN